MVTIRARRMIVRALAGDRVWSSGWKVASTSTMSPGFSLPATPVSALMRIEISCWPFSSDGGSTSIPCWSSTPAGSGSLGTSEPICDTSRSAWRPTHFSGTDFSATASGGIGCSSGTARVSTSTPVLGSTSLRTSDT